MTFGKSRGRICAGLTRAALPRQAAPPPRLSFPAPLSRLRPPLRLRQGHHRHRHRRLRHFRLPPLPFGGQLTWEQSKQGSPRTHPPAAEPTRCSRSHTPGGSGGYTTQKPASWAGQSLGKWRTQPSAASLWRPSCDPTLRRPPTAAARQSLCRTRPCKGGRRPVGVVRGARKYGRSCGAECPSSRTHQTWSGTACRALRKSPVPPCPA
mmetsp:Transcript_945/g.2716  ORF Transcript_945/g.2716 Transcript_945/m.2716 type:complete len:208 (+) Transcript_945:1302-1925(+)